MHLASQVALVVAALMNLVLAALPLVVKEMQAV
jgi:hypothetical protein